MPEKNQGESDGSDRALSVIEWRLHFRSSPEDVYQALTTDDGRRRYWAESANEEDGKIHYVFLNGVEDYGEILEEVENRRFAVTYFGWRVSFALEEDGNKGTDMLMVCSGVSEADVAEIRSGWVSWLMAMKAAVDFGVDLRNHDPKRTWFDGFADN